MKTVFFTGGHHTSALILAKKLKSLAYRVIWIGHKFTMEGVTNLSLEYQDVKKAEIEFINLGTGKIHRGGIKGFSLFIKGFFHSLRLVAKFRPSLVVSFGGYLSVPVVLAAWIYQVDSVTHEQTVTAGWANRFLSRFVKKVFLTWPDSSPFFPKDKIIITGLPLREQILDPEEVAFFKKEKRVILITGGKQGSHVLNQALIPLIPELVSQFNLIHQAGETTTTGDLVLLQKLKNNLPAKLRESYFVTGKLDDREMGAALHQATCVVCRSGAHTVYELLALGKPAVLIPFPFGFGDEQKKNAQKMVKVHLGKIVEQQELTPERLKQAIYSQVKVSACQDFKTRKKKAQEPVIFNAKEKMIECLLKFLC